MDIRLDTGDETAEEDLEEDILEGEIIEAEEVMPPKIPPERALGPPSKVAKPGVKKALIAMTIVIVVIIASLIVFIYLPRPPTEISLRTEDTSNGLRLTADISYESATPSSGKAKITITHNDSTVYTKNDWNIKSNSASITIPYDEFVMDNGDYSIRAEFQGVSDEITYEVDFVLKNVGIAIYNSAIVAGQPQFTLIVGVGGANNALPGDSEIRIESIVHMEGGPSITSGIGIWEDVTNTAQYEVTLLYDVSGNYTITVNVRNNDVKDSSDYASFDAESVEFVNVRPIPDIETTEDDGNEDRTVSIGTTVHFDGDDSQDDGNIVEYYWFFEDDQSDAYGPETDHEFNKLSGPDHPWAVTLTVTDVHGEFDRAIVYFVVTL